MASRKLTISLVDGGHSYLVTSVFLLDTESWSVLLKVDGVYRQALNTADFPSSLALQMIADAQLLAEEVLYESENA
jgi:hypothetical protein